MSRAMQPMSSWSETAMVQPHPEAGCHVHPRQPLVCHLEIVTARAADDVDVFGVGAEVDGVPAIGVLPREIDARQAAGPRQ